METLFGCHSTNSAPKEPARRSVLPPPEQENRVLDPKKSQNIAILLRALNVTRDEVSEALLDGMPPCPFNFLLNMEREQSEITISDLSLKRRKRVAYGNSNFGDDTIILLGCREPFCPPSWDLILTNPKE